MKGIGVLRGIPIQIPNHQLTIIVDLNHHLQGGPLLIFKFAYNPYKWLKTG